MATSLGPRTIANQRRYGSNRCAQDLLPLRGRNGYRRSAVDVSRQSRSQNSFPASSRRRPTESSCSGPRSPGVRERPPGRPASPPGPALRHAVDGQQGPFGAPERPRGNPLGLRPTPGDPLEARTAHHAASGTRVRRAAGAATRHRAQRTERATSRGSSRSVSQADHYGPGRTWLSAWLARLRPQVPGWRPSARPPAPGSCPDRPGKRPRLPSGP
jgi:hypothetical protein